MKKDPTFISVMIGLLILSAIFFVIERIVGRGRKQRVFRKGWWTDFVYWLWTPLVTKQITKYAILLPVAALIITKVTSADALQMRTYTGFGPLSLQPLWLQAL